MSGKRRWSAEDEEYLCENWGTISIPTLASNLGRTENGIKCRAKRLGLGAVLESGDYITLNQLMHAVQGTSVHTYTLKSWVKDRGMPVHYKRVNKNRFRVVYIDEFWEWAEKHRGFIDFSKMERFALGAEPKWVDEQRGKDAKAFGLQRKDPWTTDEDSKLRYLLKQQKYGYAEMSEMLCRSAGAIQKRCCDLGIKERPVKADNHGTENAWTDDDYQALAEGIRGGDGYMLISRRIGKSEKAIRGKVYCRYLTENADKVRAMMTDGTWGSGAPEPTIKQGMALYHTRSAVKKDLSLLAGLLKYRMNELGYDPYWQRFMCMNWDDFNGCTAGCADCDSCTDFVRIKPQYCARCGGTFYERQENRFCGNCRVARKKQAQKKWACLHKGDFK